MQAFMSKELPPVNKRLRAEANFMETPGSNTTRNINYTDEDKILEIEYRPNFMYQYLNVPVGIWKKYKETIEAGGSSGSFIQEMKIKSLYNYRKVLLNPFRDQC